jgi:hypothetical protein
MATALDYRTPDVESQYDPRMVAEMKRFGIWHPGIVHPPGSRLAQHETEIMAHINDSIARQDALEESRAQRGEIHAENLAQRKDYQGALTADREAALAARSAAAADANATRRVGVLQLLASDPSLSKQNRAAVQQKMLEAAGISGTIEQPLTAAKGEYGPEGAPKTTSTYTPPEGVFHATTPDEITAGARGATQPGLPQAPTPIHSFHPERYGHDLTREGLATAERNLNRQDVFDAQANMLLYKAGIGGENFAKIYGTSDPALIKPGMAPAADIPDIYRGTPTIPEGAGVGYYDKAGKFIGPAYSESGTKLPVPKGVAGMVGTAGKGLTYDPNTGNVVNPSAAVGQVIAGKSNVPVAGGFANIAPKETNVPAPTDTYQTPTGAFTATPLAAAPVVPSAPTSNFNVNTGFTPESLAWLSQYLNLPKTAAVQQQQPPKVVKKENQLNY